jgi:hypothetical protein
MTGLPNSLVGTKLMQEAFKPPKGKNDDELDPTTAGALLPKGGDGGEAVSPS